MINNPEYILTDVFGETNASGILVSGLLFDVKQALGLPVLNYQHGYIEELNQTLTQWEQSPQFVDLKFPLVWVAEPYEPNRRDGNFYGEEDVDVFIINSSQKEWKAKDRMQNNFKPVIYPIYRQLLEEIVFSPVFPYLASEQIPHKPINRYFFGEAQQSVLNDVVDAMKVSFSGLKVSHQNNSPAFSNF